MDAGASAVRQHPGLVTVRHCPKKTKQKHGLPKAIRLGSAYSDVSFVFGDWRGGSLLDSVFAFTPIVLILAMCGFHSRALL